MRRLLPALFLPLLGCPLAASALRLRLPVEEAALKQYPSSYGELELAELLRNPEARKALVGRELNVVGELSLFAKPDPETGLIPSVGFEKTHGTVIYRVWCHLKEPLTQEQFDRISTASFVTLRGTCSVYSRTKAAGSDLWYDLSVSLGDGQIVYWDQTARRDR